MDTRSRFKATLSGKTYRVTNNDILTLLQRYRYLPSNYIAALLGWKGQYYKDILTKLRHETGLIDCPNSSWAAANARYRPRGIRSHRQGREVTQRARSLCPPPQVRLRVQPRAHGVPYPGVIRARCQTTRPKAHQAAGHTQLSELPCATRYEKSPWRVPVAFTYDRHAVEHYVESDGEFFGLARSTDGVRTALLFPGFEADRRTDPLEPADYDRPSIKKKFIAYREIARQRVYQSRYGLPNAIVPFVTINETHKRAIMRVVEKLTDGKGSKLFIFKSMPNFAAFENFPPPTGHMVTEPWDRVGHPPYDIFAQIRKEVV